MTYTIIESKRPQHEGTCVVCRKKVEHEDLASKAVLLKPTIGNFAVCHLECCPAKHKVITTKGLVYTERKIKFDRKDFQLPD